MKQYKILRHQRSTEMIHGEYGQAGAEHDNFAVDVLIHQVIVMSKVLLKPRGM